MKKIVTHIAGAFMLLVLGGSPVYAQMTGTYSVPGNFANLAAAINSLNIVGVGAGGATINIAAAYAETAPVGGYSLTASGTAGNPIVFQKSGVGANPLITAYAGTATPVSAIQDGVFLLLGSDYVTFNSIDINDPNAANPATMEFGYGLLAASTTDGSQYNIIKNCAITLNRVNNAAGSGPSAAGSRGINVVCATSTAQTSALTIGATTGANSYNKFYNNVIQNCNTGISLYGGSAQAYYDTNNDIGGTAAATSNTIINFGGGAATSAAYGVYTMYQQNINVANNIIDNNNGAGVNHPTTLYGIYLGTAAGANSSILTNTLTLSNGSAAGTNYVIYNASGSAVANTTVEISNNVIANCNNTIVTSGSFYGINNAGSAANVNMNNNTFTNNIVAGAATGAYYGIYNTGAPASLKMNNNTFTATTTQATSGPVYHIYQAGSPTASISIQNNDISWTHSGATAHSGAFYGIYNTASGTTATLNVSGNDFSNITRTTVATTENMYFISLTGAQSMRFVNGNTWTNLNLNHSYYEYLITNAGSVTNTLTVNSNSIVGTYSRGTGISHYMYCIYNNALSTSGTGVRESAYNNFSNISATNAGGGYFYGVFDNSGGSTTAPYGRILVHDNLFSNITFNTTSPASYMFYGINSTNYIGSDGTNASAVYSNTITNINYQGIVYGYYMNANYSDPARSNTMYANEISNVTSAYTMYGMFLTTGVNSTNAHLKVYANKIANLTCTTTAGPVYGIYENTIYYADIYNNMIGQLYSNYSSGTIPSVAGLYVNQGYANLWYNTVHLDAGAPASASTLSVTAANFASAAAFVGTAYSVDMKNNILINKSVPIGTGKTTALWRASFALNTFSASSNNNLFYAGIPTASNVVYYDGTFSFQSLLAYKMAFAPRDSSSMYESVTPFLSTVTTATNYLHIDPSQVTLARNHALNITGITGDYDTDIRQGNTGYTGSASLPDIGADEFNTCVPPLPPLSTSALSDYVVCGSNGGVTSLSASGNGTIDWYNVPVGGSSMSTGNSFTTPSLTANAVFYAAVTTSCSSARTAFNVVLLSRPAVSIMSATTTICEGTPLSLIAFGDPATYTWSPSGNFASVNSIVVSPSITTVYSVAAAAAYGCTSTASVQIVVNPSPSITVTAETRSVICKGEVARLKASGAQTYTWTSNSMLANEYTVQARPNITTIYTITGADANGCVSSTTIEQKVAACTGINENASGNLHLTIYPNPTNGEFTVELNNGMDKTIELFDLTGRMVMTTTSGDNNITININQLANGVYSLKVRSNSTVEVVKVVKQ